MGYALACDTAFDTITVQTGDATDLIAGRAHAARANLRHALPGCLGISLDETTTRDDLQLLWSFFAKPGQALPALAAIRKGHRAADSGRAAAHQRFPHAPGVQHAPLRNRRCCATCARSPTRTWRWTAA